MFDAVIGVLSHDPSKTNHPNLLAIFDVGNVDGLQYLVSELLEGKTQRELLNDGALHGAKW